jgi:hypothetical protein
MVGYRGHARFARCCPVLTALVLVPSALAAEPLLPPAIDGDVREWDAPAGAAVEVTTCADRIYLRIALPEAVVLQDNSGVVIY